MKRLLFIALLGISLSCGAQLRQGQIIRLYDGPAPGSEALKTAEKDIVADSGHHIIINVSDPTLEVFLPEKPNGAAMLVCPGGGFAMLSYTSEGTLLAERLAREGFTAFVLKYRLNPLEKADGSSPANQEEMTAAFFPVLAMAKQDYDTKHPGQAPRVSELTGSLEFTHLGMEDGLQAMKVLRSHAGEWGFDADRIGVVGFSAGSMITLHIAQNYTEESRPAFLAPIYTGWEERVKVPSGSIPMFLCSPVKDLFTPDELISNVYLPWREAGYPVELHTYYDTVHGYGAVPTEKSVGSWVDRMLDFMKDCQFISR